MSDTTSVTTVSPLLFLEIILEQLLNENEQTSGAVNSTVDSNDLPTSTTTTETPETIQETPPNKKRPRKPALRKRNTTTTEPAKYFQLSNQLVMHSLKENDQTSGATANSTIDSKNPPTSTNTTENSEPIQEMSPNKKRIRKPSSTKPVSRKRNTITTEPVTNI